MGSFDPNIIKINEAQLLNSVIGLFFMHTKREQTNIAEIITTNNGIFTSEENEEKVMVLYELSKKSR